LNEVQPPSIGKAATKAKTAHDAQRRK